MPKNVVVFSDGTGQDGGVRPEQRLSNVYKLYRIARSGPGSAIDPRDQVAFYDAGLGTDIGATATTAPVRFVQKLLASVTGRGITVNIADCYEFIINHYEPGDRIFLIGFSRGAYTARCVANLLMLCGVPTHADGQPLMRFRKQVRDIAEEAVNDVLEFGAGHPRADYEKGRVEMARRFRAKYGSNGAPDPEDPEPSNAAPHLIGVFDTVAALGAQGARRRLIQWGLSAGFALGASLVSFLPSLLLGAVLAWLVALPYWWTVFALWVLGVAALTGWLLHRQKESYKKTIRDFPKPGDEQTHYAEWKGENFDKLLSRHVHYAYSANAIDERRKDFDRVGWGGAEGIQYDSEGRPRLVQWWFAGNHSDVGGSYPEAESRLSDIALQWMIEHAIAVPDGLKTGPVFVHGEELKGTGKTGEALYLYPSADGVQHCEIAGMRDTLDRRAQSLPGFLRKLLAEKNWDVKDRKIDPKARLHPTVMERFRLDNVVQCTGGGAYRPTALQHHEALTAYYPKPPAPAPAVPASPAPTAATPIA